MKKAKSFLALLLAMIMVASCIGCAGNGQSSSAAPAESKAEESKAEESAAPEESKAEEAQGEEAGADIWSGDQETLSFMCWGANNEYMHMQEIFFETYPEIANRVKVEWLSGGDGDVVQASKFRLCIASGELPDVVLFNWGQVAEFGPMDDVIIDAKQWVQPYEDQIIDGVVGLLKCGEKYVGFPEEVKGKMFFYRKDIFNECEVDPTQWKTLDDFIAGGKKIQEKYPNSYLENITAVPVQEYDILMFLSGNGGSYHDKDGNYDCKSDAKVKEAFEQYKKLYDSGVCNTDIVEWSADWGPAFADGTLVSQLIGQWFKKRIVEFVPEQAGQWACSLWPEEVASGSENAAAIWMITTKCANPDLAGNLLAKMFFDEKAETAYYNSDMAKTPVLKKLADDPAFNTANWFFDESLMKYDYESMKILKAYDFSNNTSAENTIVCQGGLSKYLTGELDIDAALALCDEELTNQIGNAYNIAK